MMDRETDPNNRDGYYLLFGFNVKAAGQCICVFGFGVVLE